MGACYDCKYKKCSEEETKKYCLNCIDGSEFKEFEIMAEVKEDKVMTKNFKEVIADIKEGEVWTGDIVTIRKLNGYIDIEVKNGFTNGFSMKDDLEFTLQRQKVSFTEAFKGYEEGKEIESSITSNKWAKDSVNFASFLIEEIRGEWYINA